jgi:hypothetical protein
MSRISGRINLAHLKAQLKTMKGQSGLMECIVIPIHLNHLYKGEKGVYLDLIAFEIENKKTDSKDTHLVKQSLPKDVRERMSSEDLKAMPIIGNLQVWDSSFSEAEPQTDVSEVSDEESDLPF